MLDWKQIPKIDAHIHLLPNDVIAANQDSDDPFIQYGSVDSYLDVMKEYNIQKAVIMPFNDPYLMSMDFTIEAVHDNLKQIANHAPSQFCWFADVDIRNDIGHTIAEINRVRSCNAFAGIKLHPTNTAYPIDGAYYDKIFQFANEHGTLIEIHSYPRTHLIDDVCSPSRIKNVLNKYANLKISIAHLGGLQFEALYGINAYVNISAVLPDLVNKFGIGETNRILRKIGVEKLIFATDYPDSRCLKPTEIYDTYLDILSQMDFTLSEAECICKSNAETMLGME